MGPGHNEYGSYLDWKVIADKKLSRREVAEAATETVRALPHIFRAYTHDALEHGEVQHDFIGERVTNGFIRSGPPMFSISPNLTGLRERPGLRMGLLSGMTLMCR